MWARLSYTSLFEKIVETAVTTTAPYGALVSVEGAAGGITIHTPNLTGPPAIAAKMCFDFGVVNADGAFPVTIDTPDGKTINGGASIVLPASPGASALVFFDATNGDWVALVGGGAASLLTIASTTTTPVGFAVTTVDTPAVLSPAVAVATGQKVLVLFSCEVDSDSAVAHFVTLSARVDGGAAIDTFVQTSTTVGSEVVSWHFEVAGLAPGTHVFQVNIHADANGIFNLVTNALRLTTVTLPG